jgi:hypothetical protein
VRKCTEVVSAITDWDVTAGIAIAAAVPAATSPTSTARNLFERKTCIAAFFSQPLSRSGRRADSPEWRSERAACGPVNGGAMTSLCPSSKPCQSNRVLDGELVALLSVF